MILSGVSGTTPIPLAVTAAGRPLIAPPQERNPLAILRSYAAIAVAPHTLTVRWTYTVPANRRMIVSVMRALAFRDGVATVLAPFAAAVRYTPAGGSPGNIIGDDAAGLAIGTKSIAIVGCELWLYPGDTIDGLTADSSADGTVRYQLQAAGTEFDA